MLIILTWSLAVAVGAAESAPFIASDLPSDPNVTWGTLPNGLRWAILPNQQPPGTVSMRVRVAVGSTAETDPEQGLAHVLEHLAFNGTTHFPPGELNKTLQPLGIGFGSHSNAHTSFDETVYKLDLPNVEPVTLDLGLRVLADFVGGMLLEPKELDSERGVVLAEMRDRESPAMRTYRALYATMYAGTPIPQRFPIGLESTVSSMSNEMVRNFYHAWYTPDRLIVTVVGDVQVADMQQRLQLAFGALTAKPTTDKRVEPTEQGLLTDVAVGLVHAEPDGTSTTINVGCLQLAPIAVQNRQSFARDLIRDLADACLSQRLDRLIAQDPQGPLVQVGIGNWRWMTIQHALIQGTIRDGRQSDALTFLAQEWDRYYTYGPTAQELISAIAKMQAAAEAAVIGKNRRENSQLASGLYSAIAHDQVVMAPESYRDEVAQVVQQVTHDQVLHAFQEIWQPGRWYIAATGPQVSGTEAELITAWNTVVAVDVAEPVDIIDTPFAYAQTPDAGIVGPWTEVGQDIKQAVADNGVALVHQQSARKPGEVRIRWRFTYTPGPCHPAVKEFAERFFLAGGLGQHAEDELDRILAAKPIRFHFRVRDDGVIVDASCMPKDVERALQILRAYVTDPGWRADGERRAKDRWLQELAALPTDLDAQVGRAFDRIVVGDTPGRRQATPAEAAEVTADMVKTWLQPILQQGASTVAVVGDTQSIPLESLLATYVATIEARQQPVVVSADTMAMAPCADWQPQQVQLAVPGPTARALIRMAWKTDDMHDIRTSRRLQLVAQAIQERLNEQLREALGQAYSPRAWSVTSDTYQGFGFIALQAAVEPSAVGSAQIVMREVVATLAAKGVDDALLAQIQPPTLSSLRQMVTANNYWLESVCDRSYAQPFRIAWSQSLLDDYSHVTSAELSAVAATYLVSEPVVVVGVCTGTAPAADK